MKTQSRSLRAWWPAAALTAALAHPAVAPSAHAAAVPADAPVESTPASAPVPVTPPVTPPATLPVTPPVTPSVTPAPAQTPQPSVSAPADPVDYGSLMPSDDPTQPETKLDIYGFADFSFGKLFLADNNRWNGYLSPKPTFGIGNLNVYFSGHLSSRVRSLVEVRFLYLPNGVSTIGPDGKVTTTNTSVQDPVEIHRQLSWGGISIERAWVEFEAHELLVIRAGQFLTPYGIWNVDHGSPTIIGVRRPFVVTEALLPERQTGIEIHGRYAANWGTSGYHLTISNGRGIANEYIDQNDNKAVGGRLFATTRKVGELTLGGSFFRGRQTAYDQNWTQDAAGVTRLISKAIRDDMENSVAFDLKWMWQSLLVQAEFMTSHREFEDGARPRAQVPYLAYEPDHRRWGGYGLVAYRTPFWNLMPYFLFEQMKFAIGDTPNVAAIHAGVNVRPDPALVLKLEFFRVWFPGALPASMGKDNVSGLTAQVAWVF